MKNILRKMKIFWTVMVRISRTRICRMKKMKTSEMRICWMKTRKTSETRICWMKTRKTSKTRMLMTMTADRILMKNSE